jgi:hypothetical protein
MANAPTWRIGRGLFTRGVGLSLVCAAGSLWRQIDGLVGPHGILPIDHYLAGAAQVYPGNQVLARIPTLMWWLAPDRGLHQLLGAAIAIGAAVIIGTPLDGPLLLVGWAVWLSIVVAGQTWLTFQWDALLVESLMLAALVARWTPRDRDPPGWSRWLVWLLAARLMFFGGLVKLTSGDPSWRDGTALTFHYWTQPLPNPASWWFAQAPVWFHQASTALTFAIELGAPWLIFVGPVGRRVAAAAFVLLMGLLAFTGNYGYFQLLAVVLSLALVDDAAWLALLARLRIRAPAAFTAPDPRPDARWWSRHRFAPVGAVLLALATVYAAWTLEIQPPAARAVRQALDPFRTVNAYGLFATMTKERPEVQLEVTTDGRQWIEWDLPDKPGDPLRRPPQVAPDMPRLDWRMWFAALGSCDRNTWVPRLQAAILRREPSVIALLGPDPVDGAALTGVRTIRWDYTPTHWGEPGFWKRRRVGPYCPATLSTR